VSKFIRNLALFIAGLPLTTKGAPVPVSDGPRVDDPTKTVSLRPLNLDMNNLFASHRSHSSHSSHRSHSSHYSGSGSSYPSTGVTGTVSQTDTTSSVSTILPPSTMPAGSSSVSSAASPSLGTGSAPQQPQLSIDEKRRLQIMRVQIKLLSLGIYSGRISGVLDDPTKQSLKLFQSLKHLPETGLMTTPTMNALEVPAVN
jgi:His-Xaa-Ser repeat protein HxsA